MSKLIFIKIAKAEDLNETNFKPNETPIILYLFNQSGVPFFALFVLER